MIKCASLVLILFLLTCFPAQAEPLGIDEAIEPSGMIKASLSPDGKHIAAIIFNGTNYGLFLVDTSTFAFRKIIEGKRQESGLWRYLKAPRDVTWAGNDTLAIDYGLEAESADLQGKKLKSLGEAVIGSAEYERSDSTRLLVYTDVEDGDVALCDARAGKCVKFSQPRGKAVGRAFDRQGRLRAVSMVNSEFWKDASTITNWYKPSDDADWVKLEEFKVTDDFWIPVYVPDEPGKLVINSRVGRDTYALFDYDVAQRRQGELLAGSPTQDIRATQGIDQAAFKYVKTGGMLPTQIWFDSAWASMQKTVDVALPGRINILSGNPAQSVLIFSYGDVDPGTWYFLDVAKRALTIVGKANAAIDPARMRHMEVISYRSGDGLQIPAYLTRPADAKGPAPLVVLIHGGPQARDTWSWNAEVQLLASRGYLVFQPQFRGSSGFGRKFEQAGYGQWGRAMQDDITAGVDHLVRQGLADPNRICIVGASYGGYAALWGLVKTPELYRCAVSFAGVVDIAYMFSDSSDTASDKVAREVMTSWVGDKKLSVQLFDPVSPLQHAAEIKAPVLLLHGEDDERVPISHGKKMKRALEENKKNVRWITFEDEGHGLRYTRNQYKYYEAVLGFLAEHLGAP